MRSILVDEKTITSIWGYAILLAMESHLWSDWSGKFQRANFTTVILAMLEGGGPFRSLIAQGMLAVSPFIGSTHQSSWAAFAEMLEDRDTSRAFAAFLRGEGA